MKIYFDNCSIQRPLDNRTQIRITLEAEAVLGVIHLVEEGKVELVSSQVLLFEIERNPNPLRQEMALELLEKAKWTIALTEEVEKKSREFLHKFGLKPLDALHLASAEAAQADYFCTCDDALLKRAKLITGINIKAVSPIELIEELESWK